MLFYFNVDNHNHRINYRHINYVERIIVLVNFNINDKLPYLIEMVKEKMKECPLKILQLYQYCSFITCAWFGFRAK